LTFNGPGAWKFLKLSYKIVEEFHIATNASQLPGINFDWSCECCVIDAAGVFMLKKLSTPRLENVRDGKVNEGVK
jgi:hypothetical protein